ncbi:unnamed protein product [Sphagnum troendelagicum]
MFVPVLSVATLFVKGRDVVQHFLDSLQEKCDPARLEAVLVRRNENAKILAKELLAELQGSSLDGPSACGSAKEESEDDGDVGAKGRRQSRSTKKSQEINAAPKAPAGSSDPKKVVKHIESS